MKKIIHKISAFLMVLVVLMSTMSFTISMHYCQGELVDTAIFQKAHNCGMEMDVKSDMSTNGCCDDKEISLEGQDELKLPISDLSQEQQLFVASFLQSYLDLFQVAEKRKKIFFDYPPPFQVRQLFKLNETYII